MILTALLTLLSRACRIGLGARAHPRLRLHRPGGGLPGRGGDTLGAQHQPHFSHGQHRDHHLLLRMPMCTGVSSSRWARVMTSSSLPASGWGAPVGTPGRVPSDLIGQHRRKLVSSAVTRSVKQRLPDPIHGRPSAIGAQTALGSRAGSTTQPPPMSCVGAATRAPGC